MIFTRGMHVYDSLWQTLGFFLPRSFQTIGASTSGMGTPGLRSKFCSVMSLCKPKERKLAMHYTLYVCKCKCKCKCKCCMVFSSSSCVLNAMWVPMMKRIHMSRVWTDLVAHNCRPTGRCVLFQNCKQSDHPHTCALVQQKRICQTRHNTDESHSRPGTFIPIIPCHCYKTRRIVKVSSKRDNSPSVWIQDDQIWVMASYVSTPKPKPIGTRVKKQYT